MTEPSPTPEARHRFNVRVESAPDGLVEVLDYAHRTMTRAGHSPLGAAFILERAIRKAAETKPEVKP